MALATALTVAALALAGCGGSASDVTANRAATTVQSPTATIMTRNLYLGADVQPIFDARAANLAATLQAAYDQLTSSEVDARLAAVAHEIASTRPDLIALQEASLWTVQPADGGAPTVLYDFLATLQADLTALGAPYTAAVSADGFNGGLPVDGVGLVTMQDRDVILSRTGSAVTWANAQSGTYSSSLTLSVVSAPIVVKRSWASIDATVAGRTFTLIGTHLEAFAVPSRDAQLGELLAHVGAEPFPTVVAGDLNSPAAGKDATAYKRVVGAGYIDAWTSAGGDTHAYTCCRDADLKTGELDQRIDFVLLHGAFTPRAPVLVGVDAGERTPGGRWPSDHAGVVVTVDLT